MMLCLLAIFKERPAIHSGQPLFFKGDEASSALIPLALPRVALSRCEFRRSDPIGFPLPQLLLKRISIKGG